MPDVTGLTAEYAQELIAARLRWGGVWDDAVQYAAGDLVRVQDTGSLWVAIEEPLLGAVPALTTDPEKWRKSFASTVDGATNSGGNSLEAVGGHLESSGASTMAHWPYPANPRGTDQDYVQAKFHHAGTDAADNHIGVHFGGTTFSNGVMAGFQYDRLAMFTSLAIGNSGQLYPGGSVFYVEQVVVGGMPTDGWLRLQRDDNDYHFSYYAADPATGAVPVHTLSRTLTDPGHISAYGDGVDLVAGVSGKGVTDTFWFDDVVLATPYSGPEPSWELVKA